MSKIATISIVILIISIFINILNLIAQHLEDGEISLYQLIGILLQTIVIILIFL